MDKRGKSNGRMCMTMQALLLWLVCAASLAAAQSKNSCLECHSGLPEPLGVSTETFAQSVHAQKGLGCVACHGGDATSDDP